MYYRYQNLYFQDNEYHKYPSEIQNAKYLLRKKSILLPFLFSCPIS